MGAVSSLEGWLIALMPFAVFLGVYIGRKTIDVRALSWGRLTDLHAKAQEELRLRRKHDLARW